MNTQVKNRFSNVNLTRIIAPLFSIQFAVYLAGTAWLAVTDIYPTASVLAVYFPVPLNIVAALAATVLEIRLFISSTRSAPNRIVMWGLWALSGIDALADFVVLYYRAREADLFVLLATLPVLNNLTTHEVAAAFTAALVLTASGVYALTYDAIATLSKLPTPRSTVVLAHLLAVILMGVLTVWFV